jgi:hypothetical protein
MKLSNIIKSVSLAIALSIASVTNSQAATTKQIYDGITGQDIHYICAETPWNIRHLDGKLSGKHLLKGECMEVDAKYPQNAIRKEFDGNTYIRVRGASGNVWLLRMDKKAIELFTDDC